MSANNLVYKDCTIRRRKDGLLSITDLWKAEGTPSTKRPDRWVKSQATQEFLGVQAATLQGIVKKDDAGKIIAIAGILEVSRGGDKSQQGAFANPPVAIAYAKFLSDECHSWLSPLYVEEKEQAASKAKSGKVLGIPTNFEDFDGKVRFTDDGRISVYDAIAYVTGHKNPYQVWNDLCERFSVFLQKTEEYKFPGRGGKARLTPVATLQVFLEILVVLPGPLAAAVREEAVRTLIRAMNGDPSLVEEILERIHNPQDLVDLEIKVRDKRVRAYGYVAPIGSLENPITELNINSEIRKGYGWAGKEKTMESLLTDLANYRGTFTHRQVPYKSYSFKTAKRVKSRRIDLLLMDIDNLRTVHVYEFKPDYIDDVDVTDTFLTKAYPEIVYNRFSEKDVDCVVAHLVSPGGITQAGIERLNEVQMIFDNKYGGKIKLNSMLLWELVWNEMFPAIERLHKSIEPQAGTHFIESTIRPICKRLCDPKLVLPNEEAFKPVELKLEVIGEYQQLKLF